MITIRFGRWNNAVTLLFIYTRIYWKGRWTPFCKMRVHWVNVLPGIIKLLEWDWRQAVLNRLYARMERYHQPFPRPGRYDRALDNRYQRDRRP